MKYRKLPVEIEAFQLYPLEIDNVQPFLEWAFRVGFKDYTLREDRSIAIETLEGTMIASPGDWVIRGVAGEFYPCHDSIFRATYEAVEDKPEV